MRKAALIGSVVFSLAAAGSVFAVSVAAAAPPPGLQAAIERTASAPSRQYAFTVRITKDTLPLVLRVQGQQSGETISVRLKLRGAKTQNGMLQAAATGATLLLGPFLYEQAPVGVAVAGKVLWVRSHVADLAPDSVKLQAVHALTPAPLLRILGEARVAKAGPGGRLYRGTVAYNNPVVGSSLARLTGGREYRGLRLSAYVGRDGLVHRLLITGHTADRASTLALSARLFAFGKPVHVRPPAPGTFVDDKLGQLTS